MPIRRWIDESKDGWVIESDLVVDIKSLRYMDSFQTYLMNLSQNNVRLLIDEYCDEDEEGVIPDKEPEADLARV